MTNARDVIEFRKEKVVLEQTVKQFFDPLFSANGYIWERGNFWNSDIGWAVRTCSLGLRKLTSGFYLELIGGASLYLKEYHAIVLGDDAQSSSPHQVPTTIGGPVEWFDRRLKLGSGRFTTGEQLNSILPVYHRAFEQCVIPELQRHSTERDLLNALLADNWKQNVKTPMTQDRRGALVALLLAKAQGKAKAIAWAESEVIRIKEQKPGEDWPSRWMDLRKVIEFLRSP